MRRRTSCVRRGLRRGLRRGRRRCTSPVELKFKLKPIYRSRHQIKPVGHVQKKEMQSDLHTLSARYFSSSSSSFLHSSRMASHGWSANCQSAAPRPALLLPFLRWSVNDISSCVSTHPFMRPNKLEPILNSLI